MILDEIKRFYPDFEFPASYNCVQKLNLTDYGTWYFIPCNQIADRITGLKKRYPKRKLIPFARRDDCDDIACFELYSNDKVQVIHDFASEGYEQRETYSDFWQWFREAIEIMIEACNNGDLD